MNFQNWSSEEISGRLENLFEVEAESQPGQAYHEAASVLASFNIESLHPVDGERDPKAALAELLQDVDFTSQPGPEARWTLKPQSRRVVLKRLLEGQRIDHALQANGRPATPLQQMLEAYLHGTPPPLETQSLPQLNATLQVSDWLTGIVPVPSVEDVQARVEVEVLLKPFRDLADQFAGREAEMNDLSDYVGVFASTSFSESAVRFVEKTTGSHQRPPLFIQAPGGMGKSTLVAEFILEHYAAQYVDRFPFAYLDFDRPGLLAEEPITLLLEVVRQFAVQYPASKERAADLRRQWANRLKSAGPSASHPTGGRKLFRVRDRDWFYNGFAEYVNSIRKPKGLVLLVLDTFEEVQQRSKAFVDEVFDFLGSLQRRLPELRTILAGRAPIDQTRYAIRPLTLPPFDPPAAQAFLRKQGVSDYGLIVKVVDQVGGSPLTLKLAARLLRVEEEAAGPEGIQGLQTSLLGRIMNDSVQVQLYTRILKHIRNPEVRKLAQPGLILRRITPELIQKVLAGPCGISVPDLPAAERLFDKLSEEISLVDRESPGVLLHRSDVRALMLQFRDKADEKRAREVSESAIVYYSQLSGAENRGEELYHLLLFDLDRSRAEPRVQKDALPFVLRSINELPDRSKAFLAARTEYNLADEIWKKADLPDWELHAARQAAEFLELQKPQEALEVINERTNRTPDSPLYGLEIDVLIRIGDLQAAIRKTTALSSMASSRTSVPALLDAALRRARLDELTKTVPPFASRVVVLDRVLELGGADRRLFSLLLIYLRLETNPSNSFVWMNYLRHAAETLPPETWQQDPELKKAVAQLLTPEIKNKENPTVSPPTTPTTPTGLHTPVSNRTQETAPAGINPVSVPPNQGSASGVLTPLGDVESIPRPPVLEAAEIEMAPDTTGLSDVGVASFGKPLIILETVHGPDNRVRVTQTSSFPWRVHASLLITAGDGSGWIGTGWFIGPHTLATAGHCVYIKNSGVPGRDGWVKSIKVMPGRDGNILPYGSVTSDRFWTVKGWVESGDENYDYAAIILPKDTGSQTGWFGIGVYTDDDLKKCVANISGYPSDKDPGTQWYDSHQLASVSDSKLYYDIDTVGGQSGSAVYRIIDGKQFGIGVHAYGGAVNNSGTRISNPVYQNLTAWSA